MELATGARLVLLATAQPQNAYAELSVQCDARPASLSEFQDPCSTRELDEPMAGP